MAASAEWMAKIRAKPRYRKDKIGRPRKVHVRSFLAEVLGLSPQTIGRLFSPYWYRAESVAIFLAQHGYNPPKRGRKRSNGSKPPSRTRISRQDRLGE